MMRSRDLKNAFMLLLGDEEEIQFASRICHCSDLDESIDDLLGARIYVRGVQ